MVSLQSLVVGKNLCGREKKCDPPQSAIPFIPIEQHRRQTDPVSAQQSSHRSVTAGLLGPYQNVAPPGLQSLDFVEHPPSKLRIARGKRDDDRFRVLAENPEDGLLERGSQRNSMETASPATRCFASGLAMYSTSTLCGGF